MVGKHFRKNIVQITTSEYCINTIVYCKYRCIGIYYINDNVNIVSK